MTGLGKVAKNEVQDNPCQCEKAMQALSLSAICLRLQSWTNRRSM